MLGAVQVAFAEVGERRLGLLPLGPRGGFEEVPDLVDRLFGVALVDRGERQPQVESGDAELGLGLAGEHLLDQVLGIVDLAPAKKVAGPLHRLSVLAILDGLDDVADVVERVLDVIGGERTQRHPVVGGDDV